MGRRPGEAWEYRTNAGLLFFCPADELFEPIQKLLLDGALPAWVLEHQLAAEFKLTDRERKAMLANGHRAWENHVAWALSGLTRRKSVTKLGTKAAPDDGRRGIYKLNA